MSNAPCEINELDTRKPELAQALADLGGFFYEGGVKEYNEWAKALRREVGQRVSEAALQSAWLDVKLEVARNALGEAPVKKAIPQPVNFVEELAKKLGKEKAAGFLEAIADEDGEPTILQKLIDRVPLNPAEAKQVRDAWAANAPTRSKPTPPTEAMQAVSKILDEVKPSRQFQKQAAKAESDSQRFAREAREARTAEAKRQKLEASEAARQGAKFYREQALIEQKAETLRSNLAKQAEAKAEREAQAAVNAEDRRTKRLEKATDAATARRQAIERQRRISAAKKEARRLAIEQAQKTAGPRIREKANTLLESLRTTGKPSATAPARVSAPLLDVATAEYAKGAKSIDMWAKGVEKRLGETLPDNVREELFKEAARRFAVENQPVERIRREMAQKIESEVLKTRPAHVRAFKTLEGYRSAMRSIVTSVDLSGLGNQGGILAIARPTLATGSRGHSGAIRHMIEAAKSEENIAMLSADITTNQEVKYGDKEFYKKVGLELSDTGAGADLTSKEENYLSNMAAKMPLVAGSERAYSAVLNSLRSATFDALYEQGMSQDEARDLARYINVATGRGDLSHSVKMATPMLANIFFSPRYAISRVQYLTAQPIFAASTSRTRRLIAKEYARYLSKIALAVTLGVAGGLVKRELPEKDKDGKPIPPLLRPFYAMTNAETGVFKIPVPGTAGGQVYLDFYSSNKQWLTFAATVLARQKAMQDGGMREAKLTETAGRFVRSKLAPDLGLAVNALEGTDFIGNPTTVEGTLRGLLPMSLSEVIKGFAELGTQPAEANRLMVSLGLIGAAAVSATGFKATYRNKTQEGQERAQAKNAKGTDPMYRILDQSSPLRNLSGIPKPPPPPPFVPRQRI